jgi:hypothetical protein
MLDAWDMALDQDPVDRALTLAQVYTGLDRAALAELSIGHRDMVLLAAQRLLSGRRLDGLCRCSACNETNEFQLDLDALPQPVVVAEGAVSAIVDGRTMRARLPNSHDLAAITDIDDPNVAARIMLQRCLLEDVPVDDAIAAALDSAMEEVEGLAALELDFTCSVCGAPNQAPFDIGSFLWSEFAGRVERLVNEIDVLASSYGWSESAILSLSDRRRSMYVRRLLR